MKKTFSKILILSLVISLNVFAQANGKNFGVSLNVNYTTTSSLYLQPDSPDPIIRATHESITDIYSYSLDARYQISESVILGLGSEYIKKTFGSSMNLGGIRAAMTDGFKVIPVEFSIYYFIPFSTERFKFFMGGGFGLYFGEQIRELGDVSVSTESKKIGYGIHVAVGMDYVANDFISVRAQMRFRDPEFEMVSKYSNKNVTYDGKTYVLPTETVPSKVNIDGITFTLGAVVNF